MKKIITVIAPLFVLSTLVGCNKAPAKEYIVSFESKGGTHVEPIRVKKGKMISKPEVEMHKDGYDFQRWCTDEACTEEFVFDTTKITNDITLYADWGTIKQCTVTFYLNDPRVVGQDVIYTQTPVAYGMPVVPPDNPKITDVPGFLFDSWHTQRKDTDEGDEEYKFGNLITSDLKLFARWKSFEYNLIIVDPNGGTFSDDTTIYKYFSAPGGGDEYKWSMIKDGCEIKTPPVGYKKEDLKYYVYTDDYFGEINDEYSLNGEQIYYIYVNYVQLTENLSFSLNPGAEGADNWWTPPTTAPIPYGTKWIDVKEQFEPTNCQDGWTFKNFYYLEDNIKHIVTDSYMFTDKTRMFIPNWEVKITFSNEQDYGTLPHSEAQIPVGTKWGDVESAYRPVEKYKEDYTFDCFKSEGARVEPTTSVTKPASFVATYITTPPSSFSDDSWAVFCNYIGGVQNFSDLYADGSPYKDEYEGNNNTFVGLERKITISDQDYRVRVVAENVDRDPVNPGTEFAFFEFEFANVLDYPVPYDSDQSGIGDYADSYLDNILNSLVYIALPRPIQEAIKPKRGIEYYVANAAEPEAERTKAGTDWRKLFVLSLAEMNYTWQDLPATYRFEDNFPVEGAPLAYYQRPDCVKTKAVPWAEGNPATYWTRSSDISNVGCAAWQINPQGGVGENGEPASNSLCLWVAPAFLI